MPTELPRRERVWCRSVGAGRMIGQKPKIDTPRTAAMTQVRVTERSRGAATRSWGSPDRGAAGNRRHDGGDRPEPSKLWRRTGRGIFVDAADRLAIGENVIILVFPLAGRARGGRSLEDEAVI